MMRRKRHFSIITDELVEQKHILQWIFRNYRYNYLLKCFNRKTEFSQILCTVITEQLINIHKFQRMDIAEYNNDW